MEPPNFVGDDFSRVTQIYRVTQFNIACCYSSMGQVYYLHSCYAQQHLACFALTPAYFALFLIKGNSLECAAGYTLVQIRSSNSKFGAAV